MEDYISIEKIEIKNYRLCKEATFKPEPGLSVLIGPNGSGKTTILRSMILLRSIAQGEHFRRMNYYDGWNNEKDDTVLKITLKVDNKKVIHNVKIKIDNDENNSDRIFFAQESWNLKEFTNSKKLVKVPTSIFDNSARHNNAMLMRSHHLFHRNYFDYEILENKEIVKLLSRVSAFYRGITYYSASKFTNPSECPVSFEHDDKERSKSDTDYRSNHIKWLKDLYEAYKLNSIEYNIYSDTVGKNGIGLIDDLKFTEVPVSNVDVSVRIGGKIQERNRKNNLVIPQIIMGSSTLSPSQLSEGTFKTLAMLFYLIVGKGSVTLIEEPEVCIHHGLLRSVIELIRDYSNEKQIFVSTHSDYILDSVLPESVFVIKKDKKQGIQINSLKSFLPKDEKNALKNYLETEGSLGEYWRAGAIDDTE